MKEGERMGDTHVLSNAGGQVRAPKKKGKGTHILESAVEGTCQDAKEGG